MLDNEVVELVNKIQATQSESNFVEVKAACDKDKEEYYARKTADI